jgi:reversibly glycosylated polypeptide/UDP-arabinopyranose mutase
LRDICLVVPTIRENSFKQFLEKWNEIGLFDEVDLIVMEDNPKKSFTIPDEIFKKTTCFHLDWEVIRDTFEGKEWIIPRRSDTVRSFAYWFAWVRDYKYILTLDDDCYPPSEADGLYYDGKGFIKEHLKNIQGRSKWFNTLNSVKPRGIPFYNLGKNTSVVLNHGLWTNVLDYDAPYQLANPVPENFSFDNRLVPRGQYFPMCGMNVMWDAKITVLMYHLLMGQLRVGDDLTKLPFDRFGDIWCGIFMKKICDLLGYSVGTGMPYIRHERASNPFTNLKKEANGIEVNESLWEFVDGFELSDPGEKRVAFVYEELGRHIQKFDKFPEHNEYFSKLGTAMIEWAAVFKGEES